MKFGRFLSMKKTGENTIILIPLQRLKFVHVANVAQLR